jgi:hypothetical protein
MDQQPTGLFSQGEAEAQSLATQFGTAVAPASVWLRPVLVTAASEDGTDIVEVDARKWLEKIARTEPLRVALLCSTWFCCNSDDDTAYAYREMLRTLDADTALFLVRMESARKGWYCSIDRQAARTWLLNTQPGLTGFIDPFMVCG